MAKLRSSARLAAFKIFIKRPAAASEESSNTRPQYYTFERCANFACLFAAERVTLAAQTYSMKAATNLVTYHSPSAYRQPLLRSTSRTSLAVSPPPLPSKRQRWPTLSLDRLQMPSLNYSHLRRYQSILFLTPSALKLQNRTLQMKAAKNITVTLQQNLRASLYSIFHLI